MTNLIAGLMIASFVLIMVGCTVAGWISMERKEWL